MIGLARNLRLEVVAEDVETEEQMALPARPRMRPSTGLPPQPPAPADELTELLKKGRGRVPDSGLRVRD